MSKTHSIIHPASGIDLSAPGGVQALLDFHRCHFGDAVMEDNGGAGNGGDGGAGGTGGDSGAAGQSQTAPAGQENGGQGDPDKDAQDGEKLGEGGIKALNAERDARKQAEKDRDAALARAKELEDASKTDEEKRAERFQQLEQSEQASATKIAGLESTVLRYQVAAAEGLDLEAAERLRGTTKEEIEADAKAFKAKFGTNRPGEVPGAGARGSNAPNVTPGVGRLTHAYSSASK